MERLFEKHGFSEKDLLPYGEVELLSDLRNKCFSEEIKNRIIKLAEKEQEKPLLAIPMSTFIGYYNGTHPEYIPVFEERRQAAITLSVAESIEGEGRFVNRLIDLVWGILQEDIWYHPAHLAKRADGTHPILPAVHEEGYPINVDLRTGMTIGTLSLIYYFSHELFDSISPVINERIVYEVREKALYPYLKNRMWWGGEEGGKVINWGTWISSNLLLTIACLEKDEELRRAVFKKVLNTLNSYTENYCFDGGCDEGPGYWTASCGTFMDCLDLLFDLSGGKINIYSEPHIRRMFEFPAKYNIHDNNSICFADAGPKNIYDPVMLRRMATVTGSELLKGFSGFMTKYSSPFAFSASTPYKNLRRAYESDAEYCEFSASTRVWFPDLKVGYVRESQDTSKGMFICMCGGTNGTSHNHNDLGSVIVYYGGKPILIDTGVGRYNKETFGKRRYTLTTHSSGYHNTVNIGGVLQSVGQQYCTTNESYDESTGTVTMNVTAAFSEEAGINSYVRSAGLDGGVAKITDVFDLKEEREIDIHFVTHRRPEIIEGCKIKLTEGRVLRYDSRLTAEIETYPAYDDVIKDRWDAAELYNIHLKATIRNATFVTTVE